jgi:hypothetical protein
MQHNIPKLYQYVAALLITATLTPTIASANPRPLDPGTVHVKILKRGIGNFIALQEINGVQIWGRILEIGDHSVILQLHNDPQTTEVFYTDIAYLRTGSFTKGGAALLIVGIGAVAGLGIYGAVHLHNLENKPLVPPTPVFP